MLKRLTRYVQNTPSKVDDVALAFGYALVIAVCATLPFILFAVVTSTANASTGAAVAQIEFGASPALYSISDDGCIISEILHRAVCWEDDATGLVLYRMSAGQDPLEWQEIGTMWTERLASHDLSRTWTEVHFTRAGDAV